MGGCGACVMTLTVTPAFLTAPPLARRGRAKSPSGDIVRGAALVVWAIRDGRDAATAMHDYLMQAKPIADAAE